MAVHRIGIVGCAEADGCVLQQILLRHGFLADVMEPSANVIAYAGAVPLLALVLSIGDDPAPTLELIAALRRDGSKPLIIVVGPVSDPACQIESLALGADDYIAQPLKAPEMLTRLGILLDNDGISLERRAPADRIRQVLTENENGIFAALLDAMPETLSREQIMWTARHQRISPDDRTLDVYISHIRKKLRLIGASQIIETVRGKGFRLVDDLAQEPLQETPDVYGRKRSAG